MIMETDAQAIVNRVGMKAADGGNPAEGAQGCNGRATVM